MTRLARTITVPRPLAEVFPYVANFAHIAEWDPGVAASAKLTPGPVREGSRFRLVVRFGPRRTAMEYVMKTFEQDRRIVLEGSGGPIRAVDDIRFSAIDAGTRIDYRADIDLSGLAGLAQPFIGPVLQRVGKKAMNGLQKALSSGAGVPARSALQDLMDRLLLPGALGFTSWGYELRKSDWQALTVSLAGRTAVVTGATSGLGRVTAERLAELGARVICVARDREKAERAKREITQATGNEDVAIELADLSMMAQVRALADRLLENEEQIHILVNNAAMLPGERRLTEEGLEATFATDLLSPFLLTELLIPKLEASAPARIVNVSSGGMYLSGIDLEDLQNTKGKFDGARAYARAKRGLVMLSEHWTERLAGTGVVVNAMHPGWADTPGVEDSLPGFYRLTRAVLRTPEQGADTIVWLAAAPEAGEVSGKFWLDREPHTTAVLPGTRSSAAQRRELAEALRRLSGLQEGS